jgi:hypothetical protein
VKHCTFIIRGQSKRGIEALMKAKAPNVALPSSNWVSLLTNQFGAGGGFSFTNGIAPGELQRYFRIRTP